MQRSNSHYDAIAGRLDLVPPAFRMSKKDARERLDTATNVSLVEGKA